MTFRITFAFLGSGAQVAYAGPRDSACEFWTRTGAGASPPTGGVTVLPGQGHSMAPKSPLSMPWEAASLQADARLPGQPLVALCCLGGCRIRFYFFI